MDIIYPFIIHYSRSNKGQKVGRHIHSYIIFNYITNTLKGDGFMYSEITNLNCGTKILFCEEDSVYGVTVYTTLNVSIVYNVVNYVIEESIISDNGTFLWYRHMEDTSTLGKMCDNIRYYTDLCELA